MSWGWGSHRIRKLISFPSKVLWAPTSLKSHQRGPRTVVMRATRMISSVPPHTHRQWLCIPLWWPFPASSSCILYISVWVPPWHLSLNSCSSEWTGWAWRCCPCLWQRVWTMGSLSSLPTQIILWLLILQHDTLCFWYNECHPEPVRDSTNKWSLKHFHVRASGNILLHLVIYLSDSLQLNSYVTRQTEFVLFSVEN